MGIQDLMIDGDRFIEYAAGSVASKLIHTIVREVLHEKICLGMRLVKDEIEQEDARRKTA